MAAFFYWIIRLVWSCRLYSLDVVPWFDLNRCLLASALNKVTNSFWGFFSAKDFASANVSSASLLDGSDFARQSTSHTEVTVGILLRERQARLAISANINSDSIWKWIAEEINAVVIQYASSLSCDCVFSGRLDCGSRWDSSHRRLQGQYICIHISQIENYLTGARERREAVYEQSSAQQYSVL